MSPNLKLFVSLALALLGVFALTACASAPPRTLTPFAIATNTTAPTTALTATATATEIPEMTLQATATDTPTISVTPSATLTPFAHIEMINPFSQIGTDHSGTPVYYRVFLKGYATCFTDQKIDFEEKRYSYCDSDRFMNAHYYFTSSLFDIKGVRISTFPNPNELIDDRGERLSLAAPLWMEF